VSKEEGNMKGRFAEIGEGIEEGRSWQAYHDCGLAPKRLV